MKPWLVLIYDAKHVTINNAPYDVGMICATMLARYMP
jgi:hypothetical protein